MTLTEGIDAAEAVLERALMGDEVAMVGRLVDAGKDVSDVVDLFKDHDRKADVPDDELNTIRYEAVGDAVRRID